MEITPKSKQEILKILNRISEENGGLSPVKSSISKVRSSLVTLAARNTVYVSCESETMTALAKVIQAAHGSESTMLLKNIAGRFNVEPELFINIVSGFRLKLEEMFLKGSKTSDECMRWSGLYRLGSLLIAIAANAGEDSAMPEMSAVDGDGQEDAEEQRAAEIYENSPTLQSFKGNNNVYEKVVFRFLVKNRKRVAREDLLRRGLMQPGELEIEDVEARYPLALLVEALKHGERITPSFAGRLVNKWARPADYYLSRLDKLEPEVERIIDNDLLRRKEVNVSLFDDPRDAQVLLPFKAALRVVKIAIRLRKIQASGGGGRVPAQALTPVTAAQTVGITGQWAKGCFAVQGAAIFRGLPL